MSQGISIDRLVVLNLEEDKGPFATLNDEVMLVWGVINIEKDSLITWESTKIYELSDSLNVASFDTKYLLPLDSSSHMLIALIELDDSQTAASISEKLKVEFLQYYAYPYNLLKEQFKLSLADNDLLGFLYLSPKNFQKIDKPIQFKGMNIFNRFEYHLFLSIK